MNKTIVYETHCINNLTKELSEPKKELVEQHLSEINRKFKLLID